METKYIDQARSILGIFRETIFNQVRFDLRLTPSEQTVQGELIEVVEDNRRSTQESRLLTFRLFVIPKRFSPESMTQPATALEMRFGMESFLIKAKTTIVLIEDTKDGLLLQAMVPNSLELHNLRRERRKGNDTFIAKASVLVRSGANHAEGVFELFDYSRGGFGGVLKVPNSFFLIPDATLKGQVQLGTSALPLDTTIRRAQLLEEKPGDWDSYRIGMQQDTSNPNDRKSKNTTTPAKERRQTERYAVKEHITLISNLDADISFRLEIENASVTGFAGRLLNPVVSFEFPIGSTFQLEQSHLSVMLNGFDGERLRFMIQGGDVNERLDWFKRISPYLLKGVSHSVFDTRELLEVFCASGALSSDYLKNQRTHRTSFLSSFEKTNNDKFWVHRWIHHNEQKNVTGHLCAVRVGDNGWIMTDLVGSPNEKTKLPNEFAERFFESFADFSLEQSPCPSHLYSWVKDHPYWIDFQRKLLNSDLVRERAFAGYTRYAKNLIRDASEKYRPHIKTISASEYEKILRLKNILIKNGTHLHASLIDFDVDRFGSPILNKSFNTQGHFFSRTYIELLGKATTWLVAFSNFPIGDSLNRLSDAVWVFQLEGTEDAAIKEWPGLVSQIFQSALRLGIKPSSIRRICQAPNSILLPGEHNLMDSFLTHPSASRHTRRNR